MGEAEISQADNKTFKKKDNEINAEMKKKSGRKKDFIAAGAFSVDKKK